MLPTAYDVTNKVVFITGAGWGIGKGIAQVLAAAGQMVPLGRPGKLQEVGLLALYLASSASDYMIGQTLFLDGGLSL